MTRPVDLEALLDELDMIEKRIAGERLRYGGVTGRMLLLLFVGDARPLARQRASRRRVRTLERERDRLLARLSEGGAESGEADPTP